MSAVEPGPRPAKFCYLCEREADQDGLGLGALQGPYFLDQSHRSLPVFVHQQCAIWSPEACAEAVLSSSPVASLATTTKSWKPVQVCEDERPPHKLRHVKKALRRGRLNRSASWSLFGPIYRADMSACDMAWCWPALL